MSVPHADEETPAARELAWALLVSSDEVGQLLDRSHEALAHRPSTEAEYVSHSSDELHNIGDPA